MSGYSKSAGDRKVSVVTEIVKEGYADIMSVDEAARYLGISKLSMYRLIRAHDKTVPVKKVAGAFKISKRQLLEWFESL